MTSPLQPSSPVQPSNPVQPSSPVQPTRPVRSTGPVRQSAAVSDALPTPDAARELPRQRAGAPAPGAKRRQYLRYKRIATGLALLVVVGVVAIVAGVFAGSAKDEGVEATRALLDDLAAALEAHHARVGELPARISELVNPNSPYRGGPVPEDAWRRLIQYKAVDARAGTYRLRSLGGDGKPGTADDMVWPEGTSWSVP